MTTFRVGDKVRYVAPRRGNHPEGMVGTVVKCNYEHNEYGVEFPELTIGHDLEGTLAPGSNKGWWCDASHIALVEPRQWPPKTSRRSRYANTGEEEYV